MGGLVMVTVTKDKGGCEGYPWESMHPLLSLSRRWGGSLPILRISGKKDDGHAVQTRGWLHRTS
jgi:hypothetical protein